MRCNLRAVYHEQVVGALTLGKLLLDCGCIQNSAQDNGIILKNIYIPRTMGLDTLINFLGCAALAYCWLYVNVAWIAAINQAIQNHNEETRRKVLQEVRAALKKSRSL